MSPTTFVPGRLAVKSRPIRSGDGAAAVSALVRLRRPVRRLFPAMPWSRMTRSTLLRLTTWPWRRSSAVTRGTP
jgi:hypothetical protein